MKRELIDNALAAIDALIADEGSNIADCGRYTRIAKLAAQADKIRHMAIARVGEVSDTQFGGGYDRYGYDLAGDLALNANLNLDNPGPMPFVPRPIDNPMADAMRVVIDHVEKLKPTPPKPRPPTKSDMVEEINQLLAAREGILAIPTPDGQPALHMTVDGYKHPRHKQLDIIDRRIDVLLQTIDKEDSHDDDRDRTTAPDDPTVVPTKLLRGHSPGGDEREGVRSGDDEADGGREGSAGDAAHAGGEERVGFHSGGLLGW